jgi:hypothetical protein
MTPRTIPAEILRQALHAAPGGAFLSKGYDWLIDRQNAGTKGPVRGNYQERARDLGLPHFQGGGEVPGAVGQEVPIMAHGGELVVTREQARKQEDNTEAVKENTGALKDVLNLMRRGEAIRGSSGSGRAYTPGAGEAATPAEAGALAAGTGPGGGAGAGFGGGGGGGYGGGAVAPGGGYPGGAGDGRGRSPGAGAGGYYGGAAPPGIGAVPGDVAGRPGSYGGAFNVPTGTPLTGPFTTVTLKNGEKVQVGSRVAKQFEGFFNELIDKGAPVRGLGGAGMRPNPSQHPIGYAVDWLQSGYGLVPPAVRAWMQQNQASLNESEQKWGISGGEH